MATAQETFRKTVIEALEININNRKLSYVNYLELPANQISNDEDAVVDVQFTSNILKWLGYEAGDIIYNRPIPGRPTDKPDFVVKMLGSTAFIIEDKSTDEHFNEASIKQLRRYTAGTSGYCIWTNAKSVLGLRFDPNGQYQTLVEVRVDGAFGPEKLPISQDANFEILHLLFHKQRFTNISTIIGEVAVGKETWVENAKSLTDEISLKTFIADSRFILDQLVTAIQARLNTAEVELNEAVKDLTDSQQKYISIVRDLIDKLRGSVNDT